MADTHFLKSHFSLESLDLTAGNVPSVVSYTQNVGPTSESA